MASITIAVTDKDHQVPGIACSLAADLFIMHAPPVREWIANEERDGSRCVIADDEWVNRGDHVSLTIPAEARDLEALADIRERLTAAEQGGE